MNRTHLRVSAGFALLILAALPAVGAPPKSPPPKPSQSASPTPAAKAAPPAQKPQAKVTVINGVRISGYSAIHFTGNFSSVSLSGPNTQILMTDTPSHSTLRFHADTIVSRDSMVTVHMNGHLRYTITRTPPGGAAQTILGTAGHGIYYSKAKRFEMTEGVDATLTDSSLLQGPGTIHAGNVTIEMASAPFTYMLSGNGGNDSVRLPLRERAAASAGALHGGVVDLRGFTAGTLQMGRSAEFTGPDTTIDYANPAERTTARLQARRVGAAFGGDPAALQSLAASGDVHFNAERAAPAGGPTQTIRGQSGTALYALSDQQLTLSDGVDALLTSPRDLQGPARIAAEQVSARLSTPARYEISGAPSRTLLEFTPRPRPASPAAAGKSASQTFALGTVTITGFERGVFAPGRNADITGPQTRFAAADKPAGTSARLQAGHVVATFAPDQSIGNAVASGNVHYRVERPASGGGGKQSVDGTAQRLTLTNTSGTRQIEAQGPLRAEIVDPVHLAAPGHITGQAGDSLRVDLASQVSAFDIDSPNQTATIDFVPRPTSAPAAPSSPGTQKPESRAPAPAPAASLQAHRSPTHRRVKPGK
ncbi:MAG TPA: hypothetical protein VKT32_04235 [Chthonomonadaceae bacterium]|nr:hypothetical protein [Chthonomonadaceae bacterium]